MIDPSIFEFPLSLILALVPVLAIIFLRQATSAGWLRSRGFSVILISVVSVFLAVEGTTGCGIYHHWTFIAVILITLFPLGLISYSDLAGKSYHSLMGHLGLFLVLLGGLFGAADCTDVQLKIFSDGQEEHMAYDVKGGIVQLPFSISLSDFQIDRYEDGISPKQYTSCLSIDGKQLKTAVNHPCRYKGYHIYQAGYDAEEGSFCVLKIVRDPWLPVLALGALLLAASAFLNLKETWKSWKIPAAALALAIVFTLISVARINFGTLVPALRSLWFVPHLIIYMLAYSVMALSVIAGIASLISGKVPEHLSGRLFSTASSLLLLGMLCGAVWAKQAWGNYWTWDAKECWAAVTWLLTLAGTHTSRKGLAKLFTLLAFLAIQMTWYGVNYIPSAAASLHTYNQKTSI